jgi:O-acetyl-ADP-ribose deacetylase (regulator of RNase III)
MITYRKGNLLEDDAEALVNTVNTVGVMGRGIALAFKKVFPENYLLYRAACIAGEIRTGKLWIVRDSSLLTGEKLIINFPTKEHWRDPSTYAFVESGLLAMVDYLKHTPVKSMAIPPLGCGNGGLDWPVVKGMIEKYLSEIECDIRVYGLE